MSKRNVCLEDNKVCQVKWVGLKVLSLLCRSLSLLLFALSDLPVTITHYPFQFQSQLQMLSLHFLHCLLLLSFNFKPP
ncbi:hypothetical protein VNO80_00241 [Phaseolus coccineus]|uniref:Uncharacterized protein n=1 Tax=Phaseolus coccineus TaxID=3886 RepID=A0AAN9RQQ6_PHACN